MRNEYREVYEPFKKDDRKIDTAYQLLGAWASQGPRPRSLSRYRHGTALSRLRLMSVTARCCELSRCLINIFPKSEILDERETRINKGSSLVNKSRLTRFRNRIFITLRARIPLAPAASQVPLGERSRGTSSVDLRSKMAKTVSTIESRKGCTESLA